MGGEPNMEAIRRPQPRIEFTDQIIKNAIEKTHTEHKKNGKAENTIRSVSTSLRKLNANTDLHNPEEVKLYIANLKLRNNTKQRLVASYNYFCQTNQIQWNRPKYYKWDRITPIIPTTENIYKIISGATKKYATIFTILAETGLEAHELATMQRKDIDATQGIITARGCKGHNSRPFKLKQQTAEMLRKYLAEFTSENPFPSSHSMGEIWIRTRTKLAEMLNQPELKNIPMRNLRHYFATTKYDQTKDILLIKQLLGHKKNSKQQCSIHS